MGVRSIRVGRLTVTSDSASTSHLGTLSKAPGAQDDWWSEVTKTQKESELLELRLQLIDC